MDADNHSMNRQSKALALSALAGLEAGVLGGGGMLLFLFTHSLLRGQPWWSYANLLGSSAYGSSALWRGLGRATFAGMALQILIAGVGGALFGVCFARTRGRMVSLLLGVSSGVLCFFLCHWVVFKFVGPLIPVYASQPATLLGYMILGLVWSRTSLLYEEWLPAAVATVEAPRMLEVSGIPDASEVGETNEIVPQHRLE